MSKGNLTLTTIALAGIGVMLSGSAIAAEKMADRAADGKAQSQNHWMRTVGLIQVDQSLVSGTGTK